MSKLQGALGFKAVGAGFGLIALVVLGVGGTSCGGSSNDNPGPGNDAGTDTTTPPGETGQDSGKDVQKLDGDTGGGKDSSVVPDIPSTQLATGTFYVPDDESPEGQPQGQGLVTDDGYFLVIDTTAKKLVAVPIAGGTPETVVAGGDYVITVGNRAYVYSNTNTTSFLGTFGVWSHAKGYKELSVKSHVGGFAVSADGKMIAYRDAESATKTNIAVDNADGGAKVVVATGTTNVAAKCAPRMVGTATKVAVMTCDSLTGGGDAGVDAAIDAGDGGAAPQTSTLVAYDVAGTATPIATGLKNFITADTAGTKIFTVSVTEAGVVYAADGSGPTPIDTAVFYGEINPEGTKIFYDKKGTKAGTGYVADVGATPAPKKITADDAVDIFVSPAAGVKYMEYSSQYDATNGERDLYLAPLGGGTAITLTSDPASDIFGDPFTADGSMAVFYANITVSGSALVGDLDVLDLGTAGAKPQTIANNVWVSFAPKGKVVLYNDNWAGGGAGGEGVADLRWVDASNPGATKLIAAGAENNFNVTHDKTKVLFATSDTSFTKGPGVYAATLP